MRILVQIAYNNDNDFSQNLFIHLYILNQNNWINKKVFPSKTTENSVIYL